MFSTFLYYAEAGVVFAGSPSALMVNDICSCLLGSDTKT